MTSLARFCGALALDQATVCEVLQRGADDRQAGPWFIQVIIGVAAWITAVLIVVFGAAFVSLVLDLIESGATLSAVGLVYLALGLPLLLRGRDRLFLSQFALALTAAGTALTTAGIAIELEQIWPAAAVAVVLAAGMVMIATSRILQALVSGHAIIWVAGFLVHDDVPYLLDVTAVSSALAVVLLVRPPRTDLRPAAIALLLMTPLVALYWETTLVFDAGAAGEAGRWIRHPEAGGWIGRLILVALFVSLLVVRPSAKRDRGSDTGWQASAFAATASVLCLLLPLGSAAALLIMMIGYRLGSRPLALLGILLEIYFVGRFYYDLDISLLHKSYIFAAVGIVLLAFWRLVHRPMARRGAA